MKKFLALLLALVMVFALAACGGNGDDSGKGDKKEGIVGAWTFTYEMDGEDMGLEDYKGTVDLVCNVEFDKDGTCVCTMDMDAMEDVFDDLRKDMVDYMVEMLYDELGKDDAEEYCEEEFGMSCKEYCEENIDQIVDEMMAEFEDLEEEGAYTYEDGVLELDGEELECKINGDKMTIEGSSDVIGIEDEKITLTRK